MPEVAGNRENKYMAITLLKRKSETVKEKMTKVSLVFGALVLAFASLSSFVNFNQTTSATDYWNAGGWSQVSAANGGDFTCAIAVNDQAYCWGNNAQGQLGVTGISESAVPVAVDSSGVLIGKSLTSINAGSLHTCAVSSDGGAYCWGYNDSGQLGNNSTNNSSAPVSIDMTGELAGKTIKSIATGYGFSCAIASDDLMYCWGEDSAGQLGNGADGPSLTPTAVDTSGVLAGKTIQAMSIEGRRVCVLASDGLLYCWGSDQLGSIDYAFEGSSVPVAVKSSGALLGRTITLLEVGGNHVCVVDTDSVVYCWGQIYGNGTSSSMNAPVAIETNGVLDGKVISSLAAGTGHICVSTTEGLAYCWGQNNYGQLGNTGSSTLVPTAVATSGALSGKSITAVTAGSIHTCAVTTDNYTYCWGGNFYGQLGNNDTFNSSTAVEVGSAAPSIYQDLSPYEVTVDGTEQSMSLYGAKFMQGAEVRFGTQVMQSTVIDSGTIEVTIPTSGITETTVLDITVTNPDGKSGTLPSAFTYTFIAPKAVSSVTFTADGDEKLMVVSGNLLDSEFGAQEAINRSLVSVNGTPLPFCSRNSGMTAQELRDMMNADGPVSDNPTCYFIFGEQGLAGPPIFTPAELKIWLPDTFDTTAIGTITIEGLPTYTFNAVGDEGPVTPTVHIGGTAPLDQNPEITKRPTFSGVATPGATVTVTVHSDPVVCTTTADSNGNWSCTLPSDLVAGEHMVYVRIVNPDTSVQELGPYAVTVAADGSSGTITPGTPNTGFLAQSAATVRQYQAGQHSAAIATSAIVGASAVLMLAGLFFGGKAAVRRTLK